MPRREKRCIKSLFERWHQEKEAKSLSLKEQRDGFNSTSCWLLQQNCWVLHSVYLTGGNLDIILCVCERLCLGAAAPTTRPGVIRWHSNYTKPASMHTHTHTHQTDTHTQLLGVSRVMQQHCSRTICLLLRRREEYSERFTQEKTFECPNAFLSCFTIHPPSVCPIWQMRMFDLQQQGGWFLAGADLSPAGSCSLPNRSMKPICWKSYVSTRPADCDRTSFNIYLQKKCLFVAKYF